MKTFLRKCLVLIAMLAPLCGVSAQETTVTFTASTDKISSGTSITKDNAITMSVSGGTTATFTYSPFRIYANNVITIEPATIGGGEITQITIYLTDDYSNNSQVSKLVLSSEEGECTYNTSKPYTCTWKGKSTSVSIKNTHTAQLRASSIEVTYAPASPKDETSITFANDENKSYTQGENGGTVTFTNIATLTPSEAGSITYSSNNTEIASVDTEGNVTVNTNNVGTATITASFAETDTHEASSASYTITVEKAVISGAENYVKVDGNDDFTGKYVMIGSKTDGTTNKLLTKIEGTNKYYTGVDITLTDGNQLQEIPEKAEGHAVFTITNLENGTDYTYAFYNTTTGKYINIPGEKNVTEVDKNDTNNTHASLKYSENGFEITFNTSTKYKFQYNSSSPRFTSYASNQQPIKLFRHGYSRDVTSGNFGTLCLPYGGTISGAKLYAIEGKQMENDEVKSISLVEVNNVEAGKPYIFQAAAEKLVVYYEGDIQATAGNDNGLLGSYNGTAVEAGKYVISNNTVKKCGANSKIGKNRCYIDMDNVPEKPASAAALIISFNDSTDAIESIEANADSRNAIYDLSGRRVKTAQKGLYIVNGKKIIK